MTEREIRVAQANAALEAAARVHEGQSTPASRVTSTAGQFLRWLEENS